MPKDKQAEKLISLIFTMRRLGKERMSQEASPSFSYLHLETLGYVAESNKPLMRDLARYLAITPPSATSLVQNLVKTGQLERVHEKNDRRVVRLALTQKGKQTLEEGRKKIERRMRHVFSLLNTEEKTHLIHILQKLQSHHL